MATTSSGAGPGRATAADRRGLLPLLLRLVVVAALGVVSYVHAVLAPTYRFVGTQVTLGDLFWVQAALVGLVALWLLVRPGPLAWAAAAAAGLGSFLAVVGTVYVALPAIGPLQAVFEPVWFREKVLAAVAAGVAGFGALPYAAAGLLGLARRRSGS